MTQPYPQSPVVDMNMAIVVLIVNLFFPGIGTIVAGVVGEKPLIGRGIAQLLLSIILVGWIWALVTSIQVMQNAKGKQTHPAG
jgi:ABC-type transport system involved in multi-copper enzyme maturation permease subunit